MIREGKINDAENLIDLFIEGYNFHQTNRPDKFKVRSKDELMNTLKETFDSEKYFLFIKEEKILSYISFKYNQKVKKSVWVDELVVDKNSRKQGIGTQLIEKVKEQAKKENCYNIEFCCWSFNYNAMNFYKNLNYKEQRVIFEQEL